MLSPKQGGQSILYSALSPNLEGVGGVYVENSQVKEPNAFAKDVKLQKALWDKTMALLNIKEFGKA